MPVVPLIVVEVVGIEVPLLVVGIPVHVHGADHAMWQKPSVSLPIEKFSFGCISLGTSQVHQFPPPTAIQVFYRISQTFSCLNHSLGNSDAFRSKVICPSRDQNNTMTPYLEYQNRLHLSK